MTQTSECLFCNEQAAGQNTFHEDELFRARWDLIPLRPGHAEVVPKRHVQYFEELTDEELSRMLLFARDVLQIVKKVESYPGEYEALLADAVDFTRPYLEKAVEDSREIVASPAAFNHGLNDGPDAGQSVPHLHYHIIPRQHGDVENPRGGIRRMFGADEYSNMGKS